MEFKAQMELTDLIGNDISTEQYSSHQYLLPSSRPLRQQPRALEGRISVEMSDEIVPGLLP
jgi:hypothetical protein